MKKYCFDPEINLNATNAPRDLSLSKSVRVDVDFGSPGSDESDSESSIASGMVVAEVDVAASLDAAGVNVKAGTVLASTEDVYVAVGVGAGMGLVADDDAFSSWLSTKFGTNV